MKRILTLVIFVFLGINLALSQNISFTIKPGATANSVKAYFKSNADLTGVVSQLLVTFTLSASASPSIPATTFTVNPAFPQWGTLSLSTPTTEPVDGVSSYVFTYYGVPTNNTPSTFTNGDEVLLGEIGFPAGTDLSSLKLASLPDGGTSSISYLVVELGGVVMSNTTTLTYNGDATNSAAGFSGLSYVTLNSILPVKFLSFYAIKNGDDAKLSWTVSSDKDNKYFEIERSTDGRAFAAFTQVNALANGQNTNTYQANDGLLSKHGSNNIYYRIKQVDKSGLFLYSDIRKLDVGKSVAITIFPNPSRSISKLLVDAPSDGKATITIRDANGKQLQVISTQFNKGVNQKDLNVSSLPSGDYNITILGENLNQTIKLTKVN